MWKKRRFSQLSCLRGTQFMATSVADRNLVFGILALQTDFVGREHLVAAMHAWVHAKHKPISQILVELGHLTADQQHLLEALVREHLKRHGDEAGQSLRSLGSPQGVIDELNQVTDPDVQASLGHVHGPGVADEYATKAGSSTDHGIPCAPADPYATNVITGPTPTGAVRRSIGTSTPGMRYRILRPYARGGLGEVMVAEDQELHREVALKQIQARHADDKESRERFVVEAEITGRLEHPGIVPVYGLGQYMDGRPYYAMRFIRGDSLNDAIEKFHATEGPTRDPGERNVALRELLGRFVDVCQAIAYAHSRGILHRDLKPGNIMLGKYGETLVVDWGLAKPVGAPERDGKGTSDSQREAVLSPTASTTATVMGSAVGTPQFMSPEQAAGQVDRLGAASDVYSLGATLYALLTGRAPFTDKNVYDVIQKVQLGDFPKPRSFRPNVHPALEAVCLKAMALRPEDRYKSPKQLAEDIELWMSDEPVSAWQESWVVKTGRWLRRHKTFATTGSAVVIMTTVGLTILAVFLNAAKKRESDLKLIAEKNFRLARQAVDRYHTDVSESILLEEPGMQPLRKKLLEAAGEFYEKFVEQHSNDPALKGEFARALYRLGQITADIDTNSDAIKLLKQAAAIFQTEDSTYRVDLARCYHHLGRIYRIAVENQKSEEMYNQALETWYSLGAAKEKYLFEVARSELGLGNIYQTTRRPEDALREYQKALATWGQVAPKQTDDLNFLREEGNAHTNLGMVYTALGDRNNEANAEFARAIAIQDQLVKTQPNVSKFQDDLARTQYNLGELQRRNGEPDLAVESYDAAARIWRNLTVVQPSVLVYHTRLGDTLARQALLWTAAGKAEQAIQASKEALDTQLKIYNKEPEAPANRGDLAQRHFQLGDTLRRAKKSADADAAYQDALKIQAHLVSDLPDVSNYQADFAKTRNSLGLLRLDQKKIPQAETEFDKALETWEQLQKKYPKSAEFADGIATTCLNLRIVTQAPGGYRVALEPLDNVIATYGGVEPNKLAPAQRQALYQATWTRAEARTARGLLKEAMQDWDQALALAPNRNPGLILFRAVTLARIGEADTAIAEVQNYEIQAAKAKAPEILFHIARVYAWSAASEAKKTGDAAAKQAAIYADKAMELLAQVRKMGYFSLPDNRRRLTEDADWQYLRNREPFRAFLKELDKK
jgi:eukaryotic-like serine/threonine-protein kinase